MFGQRKSKSTMKISSGHASAILLFLASCTVGPDYRSPEMDLPAKYSESKAHLSQSTTLNPWWTAFRDNRLNALVDEGLAQNLDVMSALERIVVARENVVLATAGGLPQIDKSASAIGSGNTKRDSKAKLTLSTGVSGSWMLDFFGQYKRAKEAANASLDASYNDVSVAKLAFLADLAASYAELRYAQESIALSRQNLESRRTTLKLISDMRGGGQASRLDEVQAEGLINQTLSEIPSLEVDFHAAANHIATLLGLPAATLTPKLSRGGGQPSPRYSTKIGVPADLIRNRPDIRSAERLLAAATAEIGVSEAQLYPSIALGGTVDGTRVISSSASSGLLSWSFGPSLTLPIFDGNARKARVKIARSLADQQFIFWKQTVLRAIEEVETAQIAVRRDYRTISAIEKVIASNTEALSLARESYKGGTATVLDILDAERNLADARISRAEAVRQLALDYISLNVAIGGGAEIGVDPKLASTN
jgi:outer membrane protein, multidrug efflux system